jgi:predicted site-specific integrase-resolvase
MKNEQMMTRKEVANYFNVKPQTVKQWQRFGKIKPYCRINGRPRYRLEDLQHLLTSKTESNAE